MGNQQRAGVFWEQISEHHEDHKRMHRGPSGVWKTKWGLIKHDVSSFCGVYAQVLRLNKFGTSVVDTLRKSPELYCHKSAKKAEFAFEHCWLLLKDHPKWANGWSAPKATTAMRVPAASGSSPSNHVDAGRSSGGGAQSEGNGGGSQRAGNCCPGGSKAAREEARSASVREGAIYAQADATNTMAATHMKNSALLEDQNMLMLMTMLDDKITTVEAREYLRLRRGDELKKLRQKPVAEEVQEHTNAARADAEGGTSSASKCRRQGEGCSDFDEGVGSQRGCGGWECNDEGARSRGGSRGGEQGHEGH